MDGFIAGFAYGTTSVIVGQPLDTIKTKVQTCVGPRQSSWVVGRDLYAEEGLRGLYRGGTALLLGGACIRSAQFGVNGLALQQLQALSGGPTRPQDRVFGVVDPQVVVAGFCGGVARGLVEGPFEYVKVRRQVDKEWRLREMWQGSGATVLRNSFLFASFVIYMDVSKLYVDLSPFWLGSVCANMAWLTIWPLDVVKTQMQAGSSTRITEAMRTVVKSGAFFRGLVPGLARSTIGNGCAMVAYKEVERLLKDVRKTESES